MSEKERSDVVPTRARRDSPILDRLDPMAQVRPELEPCAAIAITKEAKAGLVFGRPDKSGTQTLLLSCNVRPPVTLLTTATSRCSSP